MKKHINRITALSLSLAMLLGLTACGGKGPSAGAETPPAVETSPVETPADGGDLPPRWDIDTGNNQFAEPEQTAEQHIDITQCQW